MVSYHASVNDFARMRYWRGTGYGTHLELHPEKSRLLEFGPFAALNRRRSGLGKPETFTFLGFTHICGELQAL